MYKEILKKVIEYANTNKPDELYALFHDDIKIYRLMTNDILIDGKEHLMKYNTPLMQEGKVKLSIVNTVEFDQILVAFISITGYDVDYERIAIIEVVDGLIKSEWISQFKKDEDE